jgi:hypothetical protein
MQTSRLFLPQDLEDSSLTEQLPEHDLNALRTVADWIKIFVAQPHKDLGRAGPVCPFVPGACQRGALWLAVERIASRSVPDVIELIYDYQRLLLQAPPISGDDASYKAIFIVFTDLTAERATDVFAEVLPLDFKRLSYRDDGIALGDFHARNTGSAIRNADFRPFRAPVPSLLIRQSVISDWVFFLDDDDSLHAWARRFGASAVPTLANALRRTNWRRLEELS